MIVACVVALMINGEFEDHIITGDVKRDEETYYVVDFSNSASGLHGTGDYREYVIPVDRCSAKGKLGKE